MRSQDDSEIVVRVGVIRIECNGALTGGNRLVQVEPIPEDDPQITVPVGAIGCELETAFDQRESLIAAPFLVGEHARVVHRVGMVGRGRQDAAVHLAGSHPLIALLQLDRDRDRFVQADGAVATLPCSP